VEGDDPSSMKLHIETSVYFADELQGSSELELSAEHSREEEDRPPHAPLA